VYGPSNNLHYEKSKSTRMHDVIPANEYVRNTCYRPQHMLWVAAHVMGRSTGYCVANPVRQCTDIIFANIEESAKIPSIFSSHTIRWIEIEMTMVLRPKAMCLRRASKMCRQASRQAHIFRGLYGPDEDIRSKYSRARKTEIPKTTSKMNQRSGMNSLAVSPADTSDSDQSS
jgi:hypothetical protein